MVKIITSAEPMQRNQAIICIAVAAALWSTSGFFIKIIDLNPMAIAGIRSAIAAATMILIMRGRLRFTWSFPQVAGACAYALTMVLFVSATKATTAANAILLQYTAPVFTALLSGWILKEKVTRFDWTIIAVVIGGMYLFFLDSLTISGFWGNIMAICSGATMSFLILCLRLQKNTSPIETVILGNIITALICLPFYFEQIPTTAEWISLLYMGTLQIGFSFALYARALKYVVALDAVLLQALDPLLNPIWVLLVIGEVPGRWAIVGGVIVLVAVTMRNFYISKTAIETT